MITLSVETGKVIEYNEWCGAWMKHMGLLQNGINAPCLKNADIPCPINPNPQSRASAGRRLQPGEVKVYSQYKSYNHYNSLQALKEGNCWESVSDSRLATEKRLFRHLYSLYFHCTLQSYLAAYQCAGQLWQIGRVLKYSSRAEGETAAHGGTKQLENVSLPGPYTACCLKRIWSDIFL